MVSPEALRRRPFFSSLSDAQIKAMAMIAEEETFNKGDVICVEKEPARAFYLLVDGGVCLNYKSEDELHPETRKDFLVGEINPGDIFSISVLVESFIYTATVIAERESRVVRFDAERINELIQKDPQLHCTLMKQIAKAAMEQLAFARIQLAAAWA